MGRGRGDLRRRMAHPRGGAAPPGPYPPFLTLSPVLGYDIDPADRIEGDSVNAASVGDTPLGGGSGGTPVNAWPTRVVMQHHMTHVYHS